MWCLFLLKVPAGYRYSTMLVAGENVNDAMGRYGDLMRRFYRKDDSYRKSDLSINYLG